MAPEKDPQQFLDASSAKRKGKEIDVQVTKKNKDENLAGMKDIPKTSILIESSSESEVEDESLDVWEREARRMFPPQEENNGWIPWNTVESAIIEIECMSSRLNFVPFTGELSDSELGPEVEFDTHYFDEDDTPEVAAVQTPEEATDEQTAEPGQGTTEVEDADVGAVNVDASDTVENSSSADLIPTSPK